MRRPTPSIALPHHSPYYRALYAQLCAASPAGHPASVLPSPRPTTPISIIARCCQSPPPPPPAPPAACAQISRDEPLGLPGEYHAGDRVYCAAADHIHCDNSGITIYRGHSGEVTGPSDSARRGTHVRVFFDGQTSEVDVSLNQVRL